MRRFIWLRILAILFVAFGTVCVSVQADWNVSGAEPLHRSGERLEVWRVQARESVTGASATLHCVLFDAREFTFTVADFPTASGRAQSLGAILSRAGAQAGVNGGYFHPDYAPLGLVIAGGRPVHAQEKSRLLSGLLVVTQRGPSLLRPAEVSASTSASFKEALQSGPFLVDGGRPVPGLNATRSASRTVVLTDGARRWAVLNISGLTLAETGALLAAPGLLPQKFSVSRALNLDGGSSSALLALDPSGAVLAELPGFKEVRNYLLVTPRY